MSWLSLIESISAASDAFTAGDDATVLQVLNAASIEKKNNAKQSMRDTIVALGKAGYDELADTLANSTRTAKDGHLLLISEGLDYSDAITQSVIEAHRQALGDELTDKALAIGIWHVSPAQDEHGRDAAQADINEARDEKAKRALRDWARTNLATVINEHVDTGEFTTRQQIVDALQAEV